MKVEEARLKAEAAKKITEEADKKIREEELRKHKEAVAKTILCSLDDAYKAIESAAIKGRFETWISLPSSNISSEASWGVTDRLRADGFKVRVERKSVSYSYSDEYSSEEIFILIDW